MELLPSDTRLARQYYAIGWLVVSVIGVALGLQTLVWDDHLQTYFLLGIDSFYHGARILDVASGGNLEEWDTRGFYPEGAWTAWPWTYDWVLGKLSGGFFLLTGGHPATLLAHLPSVWISCNLALLAGLGFRLAIQPVTGVFLMLGFVLLPIVQQLHLAGRIDHHFAELTTVLLMCYCLVGWVSQPANIGRAIGLALVLALSVGVNNGLFILQIPVLLVLGLLWLQATPAAVPASLWFALVLTLTSVLVALPSQALWDGVFHYYVLSAFHVYIALCTSVVVLFLAWRKPGVMSVVQMLVGGLVLGLPVVLAALSGLDHLGAARFTPLETDSAFAMNLPSVLVLYSPLILLAPVAIVALVLWREEPAVLAIAVVAGLGFILLVAQVRFALYGVVALLVPLGLVVDRYLRERMAAWLPNAGLGVLVLSLLGVTYVASKHHQIAQWNPEYFENLQVYRALGDLCSEDPGLALVNPNQGHYVLYHSNCSVIANNATLSQRHLDARAKALGYLDLSPSAVLEALPDLKYVVVTRYDGLRPVERPQAVARNSRGLYAALLADDISTLPAPFEAIGTIQAERSGQQFALTRLFRIHQIPGAQTNTGTFTPANEQSSRYE